MQKSNSKAIEGMEVKKDHPSSTSKSLDGKKLVGFIGDVKQELKKVEWTSKDELKTYTKVVLASTFAFGFLVYFADLVIRSCLDFFNYLFARIFG